MMVFNWAFVPAITGAYLLAYFVRRVTSANRVAATVSWALLSVIAAVPGLLIALYYLHWLDNDAWFYTLRALPASEIAAAGLGLPAGIVLGKVNRARVLHGLTAAKSAIYAFILIGLTLLVFVPYAKPLIIPVSTPFQDKWKDGVCLQSTPSTCGPASTATMLQAFGTHVTERELAHECYTCGAGTECWYMARALRQRGLQVKFIVEQPMESEIPYPSIVGTQLSQNGSGHFIAVLGKLGDNYVVGDPIGGRRMMNFGQITKRYNLTGFFMEVSN